MYFLIPRRTIFTGVRRYRYVDPDYAFTEDEEEDRKRHQQAYLDFIGQLRKNRLQKVQERYNPAGSPQTWNCHLLFLSLVWFNLLKLVIKFAQC